MATTDQASRLDTINQALRLLDTTDHDTLCGYLAQTRLNDNELPPVDVRRMLQAIPGDVVEGAIELIRPGVRLVELAATDAENVLGIVYGREPGQWLDALRRVRPDVVPARHRS